MENNKQITIKEEQTMKEAFEIIKRLVEVEIEMYNLLKWVPNEEIDEKRAKILSSREDIIRGLMFSLKAIQKNGSDRDWFLEENIDNGKLSLVSYDRQ